MKNLGRMGVLLLSASLAAGAVGCNSGGGAAAPAAGGGGGTSSATSLSISGTLASTGMMLQTADYSDLSRIDLYDAYIDAQPAASRLLALSDFLVSCVTFTLPPVAGTGGTVTSAGKFTVTFGEGTVGKSFGCFITKVADDTFDPIPMVFKDTTKTGLDGEAKKDTRMAVTSSIEIPAVQLDVTAGTAVVDKSTIQVASTGTTTNVEVVPTGTKVDFTGNWVIEDLASNGLSAPSGYAVPCTFDQEFEEYWNGVQTDNWNNRSCEGPTIGMKLYMLRMAGKNFIPDSTCQTAVAANHSSGTPVNTCNGTVGTEDRYGIMLWATKGGGGGNLAGCQKLAFGGNKDTCKASYTAAANAAVEPEAAFHACGRKLGVSELEAHAFGQIDFTSDSNFVASGSSTGLTDTHYYAGEHNFATSVTVDNSLVEANCVSSNCKAFKAAANTITEGWKMSNAQTQWAQQNNCSPVDISYGTVRDKAWRCYGTFYPNTANNEYPPAMPADTSGSYEAFNEGAGGGCTDSTGKAVNFANWDEFWCNGSDWSGGHTCTNNCGTAQNVSWIAADGTATAAGYTVQACTGKSIDSAASAFVPKNMQGSAITGLTGAITCKNGGGVFRKDNNAMITEPNSWQKFRPTQASAGILCSAMPTNAAGTDGDRQKLAQLQCYAQAYEQAQRTIAGCTRDIRFNWGAQGPWDFVSDNNGPSKASGEQIFELFTYTANDAGTFSMVNERMAGVSVQDSSGYMKWVSCRMNESETITTKMISSTKMLLEMTSVSSMVSKDNPTCVAALADGKISAGTSKAMFVMSKQ